MFSGVIPLLSPERNKTVLAPSTQSKMPKQDDWREKHSVPRAPTSTQSNAAIWSGEVKIGEVKIGEDR